MCIVTKIKYRLPFWEYMESRRLRNKILNFNMLENFQGKFTDIISNFYLGSSVWFYEFGREKRRKFCINIFYLIPGLDTLISLFYCANLNVNIFCWRLQSTVKPATRHDSVFTIRIVIYIYGKYICTWHDSKIEIIYIQVSLFWKEIMK